MPIYKVIDIEGIGTKYAGMLGRAGIRTTDDILDKCATPEGRKNVAEQSGISGELILKWANMSDLMRISGVGGEYAELLEASGVDTIKELRSRNAENLVAKMAEINKEKKLVRQLPVVNVVSGWIRQSQGMEPKLTY